MATHDLNAYVHFLAHEPVMGENSLPWDTGQMQHPSYHTFSFLGFPKYLFAGQLHR